MNAKHHETDIILLRLPSLFGASTVTLSATPPIGVAYLAASLSSNGFGVSIYDGVGENIENIYEYGSGNLYINGSSTDDILSAIPDDIRYIGVSFPFSHEWPLYKKICRDIKHAHPNATIIAGGEHATAMPEYSLAECNAIDIVVNGEGEETIVELLKRLESNQSYDQVAGISYRDVDSSIKSTPRRNRISSLDDIARPAWDLLPIENYLDGGYSFGVNIGRSMPIIASRGCPYQCTFCSNPAMWTTKWLARSPIDVIDEMEKYIEDYSIDNFDFYDLTAIVDRRWILAFTNEVIERKVNMTWQLPSGTRSEAIDGEISELLYNSGCRNLSFSPESGSRRTLKDIKKKIKPHKMLEAMKSCIANNMVVKTNIILGFPNETFSNVIATYVFIMKMAIIGVHETAVWTFSAYPGSEIYNDLLRRNKIPHTDEYFTSLLNYADPLNTVSWSNHFSKRTLQILMLFGLLLFYGTSFALRPIRLISNIKNIIRNTPVTRLEHVLIQILYRQRSPHKTGRDDHSGKQVPPPDGSAHIPRSDVLTAER